MRTYCTLFDIRYLARGLALYHSLRRFGQPFELWVLCLDVESVTTLQRLALEHVHVVPLADLETADPALLRIKETRSLTEYYFTLTPVWTGYMLPRVDAGEWLFYVDADMLFYSSPEPVFDELSDASVGIVPHRFPPRDRHLERFGKFNVGLVAVRNDDVGQVVVADWRVRCLEWCYSHVDPVGGRFADQRYLDDWPSQFTRIHAVRHPGAGVAPWNWMTFDIDVTREPPTVDGEPLIFYHFHRFSFLSDASFLSGLKAVSRMARPAFERIYIEYARELVRRSREAGLPVVPGTARGMKVVDRIRRVARMCLGMLPGQTAHGRS